MQPETPKQIEQAVAGVGAAPQSELAELLYSRRMEAAAEVALRSEHADPQSMEAVAEAVVQSEEHWSMEPCSLPSEQEQHSCSARS